MICRWEYRSWNSNILIESKQVNVREKASAKGGQHKLSLLAGGISAVILIHFDHVMAHFAIPGVVFL